MLTYKVARKLSGYLFLISNIALFATNIVDTNLFQLIAGVLFMSCSVSVILSAKKHYFMFWWGLALIIAYILVALSNQGDIYAYLSIFSGTAAGLLILRGAFQRHTNKQYDLPFGLDILDKYPLAMAGVVEGSCCLLLVFSGIYNNDIRLTIVSVLWVVAHTLLIASDEYLREKIQK